MLRINGQPGPESRLAAGIVLMFGVVLFEQPAQGLLIIVLHRFEGLNYKEIATRMGTSPQVVEHYIRMAMLACRHNPAPLNRADGAVPRPAGSYV